MFMKFSLQVGHSTLKSNIRSQLLFNVAKYRISQKLQGSHEARLLMSNRAAQLHSYFFIRTSYFDAVAERSYILWRFEAETFLKMFLNLPGIVFQPISADVTDTRFLKKT